jgi:hypothetical protein
MWKGYPDIKIEDEKFIEFVKANFSGHLTLRIPKLRLILTASGAGTLPPFPLVF